MSGARDILEEAPDATLRALVESAPEPIIFADDRGEITGWNPAAERIFGYSRAEAIGQPLTILMPERFRAAHASGIARFTATGTSAILGKTLELVGRRKDGGEFPIELSMSAPRHTARYSFSAIVRDITERHQVMTNLAEAQQIARIGSWEWDIANDAIHWSDELCRIYGVDPETFEASYAAYQERIHPEDRERVNAVVREALDQRQAFVHEHRVVRPDGEIRIVQGRGRVISDGLGAPIKMSGTSQDITERKSIEAQLRIKDRMASVGTMAAGIAHEINNPLAYVMTNLDLILEDLHQLATELPSRRVEELRELATEALDGAHRVRKIVRGLKTFSHVDDDRRVPVDVTRMIDVAIDMAFTEVKHRAQLIKNYREVPIVEADESRLVQVMINLLVNAAQALPEGQADRHSIAIATSTSATGAAVIEVRDTGPGIPPDVLGRIFDPFFTTKPVGVGTGLGLSICHGIVTSLGGEIAVDSELGAGTQFRITLPAAQVTVASTPEPPSRVATTGPRRSVLVVDDDPLVGVAVRRVLKHHQVTVVGDGAQALARLAAGTFDVIVCDLMMPVMTGMELYTTLATKDPELARKMVFITGGAPTSNGRAFLAGVSNERLEKPFSADELRVLVERVVGE